MPVNPFKVFFQFAVCQFRHMLNILKHTQTTNNIHFMRH